MKKPELVLSLLGAIAVSFSAQASVIEWVDWTTADNSAGTAAGNMNTTNGVIGVQYLGDIWSAQTTTEHTTFWWTEYDPAPYTGNSVIDNAPGDNDIIRVQGSGITNTITFSQAVYMPVMAFVSVGSVSTGVSYNFDQPFTLLSEGWGWYGDGSWTQSGNSFTGFEAHGAIQFDGWVSSISWNNDVAEFWHGFTVGVTKVQPVPVPAAVWLFGSGILGLIGVARRKKS